MTHEELNHYILHYLKEDKTNSAIMLTAPWGTGKSYYIQNELIPFLDNYQDQENTSKENKQEKNQKTNKKKQKSKKCIVVSLYGIKTLNELSKELFFESKAPTFTRKKKHKAYSAFTKTILTGAIGIGKTVLKSLTTIDLDFSVDNPDWDKLYSSVDFTGKLIVLEDLERASISITEILGFVNNLVEQDGVKVLLVAYEEEILKNNDETTGSIESYKRIKEKTVGDTIRFNPDVRKAVEGILCSFQNPNINKLLEAKDSHNIPIITYEISMVMVSIKCLNLRSVIFGCQKVVDMFQKTGADLNEDFSRTLLCGTIAFALRLKLKDDLKWEEKDELSSPRLGTYVFPLLRVAYYYIINHSFNGKDLIDAQNVYVRQKESSSAISAAKESLEVLYYCVVHTEEDVKKALNTIADSLEKTKDIPCDEFGRLANYLISVRSLVGQNDIIQRCKRAMLNRLQKEGGDQERKSLSFHSGIELESEEDRIELSVWQKEMLSSITQKRQNDFGFAFDYQLESILSFCDNANKHVQDYSAQHHFASLFDVEKLIELLKNASPEQIHGLTNTFLNVYHMSNIEDFFSEDLNSLKQIQHGIEEILKESDTFDKIARYNLKVLSDSLGSFIEKLTPHGQPNPEE